MKLFKAVRESARHLIHSFISKSLVVAAICMLSTTVLQAEAEESVQAIRGQYIIQVATTLAANGVDSAPELGVLEDFATDLGGIAKLINFNVGTAAATGSGDAAAVAPLDLEEANLACDFIKAEVPNVTNCEPDVIWETSVVGNDLLYEQLWGMDKIQAPSAWNISQGSHEVVVAVIDTGVDYTHPDLAANMWANPGEIAGNGLDDDGNGYVDDIHGIDTYNNDSDPMDDHGHGTHCAGTIGAVGNNNQGVVGVNWTVKIMALKFLSKFGGGSTSAAIKLINYAAQNGAVVTNNSWGGYYGSEALKDAINAARAAGVVFVAAAGNSASDNDSKPHYPSSYATFGVDNVVGVAATDKNDKLAYFSNYGAQSVHVSAPGVSIYSTAPGNQYASMSGTSMAAPHVAGLAALVLATNPGMDYLSVINRVLDGEALPTMAGVVSTGKRINALNALTGTSNPNPGNGGGTAYLNLVDPPTRINKAARFTLNVAGKLAEGHPTVGVSLAFSGPLLDTVSCPLGNYALPGTLALSGKFPRALTRYATKVNFEAISGTLADSATARFRRKRPRNNTTTLSKRSRRAQARRLSAKLKASNACEKLQNKITAN
ncbi:S8 family serine peptidase [Oligoflexia bacterium]|nr:S8 family serine peptidase [Oligoflexia bacterium]